MRSPLAFFSLSAIALSFHCALLSAQRPTLSIGGNFGMAGPRIQTAFLGHPDQALTLVDAGPKRKGALGVLLYSLRLLPKSLPFGPDLLEIDPGSIFLTVPSLLDSQGKSKSGFPVPAQTPKGLQFAVQALVWAKGEAAPLRLSRAKLVRVLDSANGDLYIDGDAPVKGNGTPYLPYQTVVEGLTQVGKQGKGTLHIQPSTKTYPGPISIQTSITDLLGENWRNLAGIKATRPTLIGTVHIHGTATSSLQNINLRHLRILPPTKSSKVVAKCLAVTYVKNIKVEDCLFEGTSVGSSSLRGIVFGRFVQGVVSNCTIRHLNVGSKAPLTTVAAVGMVFGRAIQVTVRNCWIHDLLSTPPSSPTTFYYVAGISAGQNQPESAQNNLTITNNVIGPLPLKAPTGTQNRTDGDLFGILLSFGTQASVRNNIIHGLDFSALTSQTQQIFGISLYETGKTVELTNNILWDFRLGKVSGSIRWNVAMEGNNKTYSYKATHSCIWKVNRNFLGIISAGKVLLNQAPLLLPPLYLLKSGSPCLGTGNPLYPPKNMGIYGGTYPGKPGIQ
ncbi:MAG TPA: right-handed parallel beta-helix repeat-containing protein [Planctomycetes bacterium]|nr:right-handed parallel beta-helix repeat-containing protein [Planctomycetota bacterium]